MQNRSLTEEGLVRMLQDRILPAPPSDAVARLKAAYSRRPRRQLLWTVPITISGAAVLAMVALSAHPTYSWADVAAAMREQKQYTITDTHSMNGGREHIKIYYYRDGDLWRTPMSYGLKDRTVTLQQYPQTRINYVTIDERKDPPAIQFDVSKMLWPNTKPVIQRNVLWHGRRVDICTLMGTYRAGKVETFNQEVIVDPKTKLPIQQTVLRDSKQWGDIYEYDYSKPDPKVFVPDIHADATVYDLVKQRAELVDILSKNPDGLFIDDDVRNPMLLIKGDPKAPFRGEKIHMTIEGRSEEYRAVQHPLRFSPGANGYLTTMRLGGHDWRFFMFGIYFKDAEWLTFSKNEKPLSGIIKIGDEVVHFKNAKVLHTGSAEALLRSFDKAEVAPSDIGGAG